MSTDPEGEESEEVKDYNSISPNVQEYQDFEEQKIQIIDTVNKA